MTFLLLPKSIKIVRRRQARLDFQRREGRGSKGGEGFALGSFEAHAATPEPWLVRGDGNAAGVAIERKLAL